MVERLFAESAGTEEAMEGFGVGFGDVYHLLAYVDAVVAVHFPDVVEGNNVAAMYSQKAVGGQHVLHRLHGEVGDERPPLALQIEHHVVLHAAHIEDACERQLAQFAVDTDETRRGQRPTAVPSLSAFSGRQQAIRNDRPSLGGSWGN